VSAENDDGPEAPQEKAELPEQGDGAPSPAPTWRARLPRPEVAIALAGGALVLIAVNVLLIGLSRTEGSEASPVASASASVSAPPPAPSPVAVAPIPDAGEGDASALADAEAPPAASDEPAPDDEPPPPQTPAKETKGRTVQWAADRACSTAHVDGLSRQIIDESSCLDANAFTRVPRRKNLSGSGHLFLYLDAPARDHLLRALDAHPQRVMKVHSALRTVAQQYLLSRWAAGKRCGIQLANRPGESNHETGLALDIGEPGAWRSTLESEGFRWLGKIDRVHFDYVGAGATHHDGLDVRAFQRLWNRNHPEDALAETGHYDAATEKRLKRSPAGGFPSGARCKRGHRVESDGSARGREH
jgi:hypothetical protein